MKKGFAPKLILGLLLFGIALYLLLPVAARLGLERWLHDQGYQQVQIDSLDIEPFGGEFRIKGLSAQRDNGPSLALDEGYLNIAWLDLFQRQGHLQGLAIDGLNLTVAQNADGQFVISGLPLPAGADKPKDDGPPWGFGIDRLGVQDSQLELRLAGLSQTLKLDQLTLTGLHSWDADSPAQLTADAYLGSARVRLDGELTPFADAPGGRLHLRIKGADIAQLTRNLEGALPANVSEPVGQLTADLRLNGRLENNVLVLKQQGDIGVSDLGITVNGDRHRLNKLAWSGKLTWHGTNGLTTDGTLSARDLTLNTKDAPLKLASVNWQGKANWALVKGASDVEGLNTDGTLKAQDMLVTAAGGPLKLAEVGWQGKAVWSAADGASGTGVLDAKQLAATLVDGSLAAAGAHWQGSFGWSTRGGASSDGQLDVQTVDVALNGRTVVADQLGWQGQAGWSADTGPQAKGALQTGKLNARQPAQQLILADWAALQAPSIQITQDSDQKTVVDIASITIDTPQALRALEQDNAKPLLDAQRLTVGPSRVEVGTHLALGPIRAEAAELTVIRRENGKLALLDRLTQKSAESQSDQNAPPAEQQPPLRISVAGFELGDASRVDFTDHSVKPVFHQQLAITKLTAGAMDSAAPKTWTPVSLNGRLGEYSALALAGKAQPFSKKLNLELNGTLKSINLPPLSSYTTESLGYTVQSGQLNSEISIKVTNDVLDGEARLVLNKLTVKAADAKRLARLTHELSMPLEAALNMLRDGDDNIRLTLPVSGDIAKPSFDFSDIINTAMGNALKKAALSYIKYALQPYGSLITLAEYAGKAANRLALKDVPFPAGSTEPEGDQNVYLDKVKSLLNERPKLGIRICGIATAADRTTLGEQVRAQDKPAEIGDELLLELARRRSGEIKRLLVDRGIAPDRLFVCNPEIDPNADGKPRTELML